VPDHIRVAIIEDQREIREGLRFLIDGTAGYRCTGAFASMEEALPAVDPALADVVLCDIGLPGMSGIDGIRLLKERHPELRLVALTVYEDEDRIFQALCAGASGYLLKNTPPARLLELLSANSFYRCRRPFDPRLTGAEARSMRIGNLGPRYLVVTA